MHFVNYLKNVSLTTNGKREQSRNGKKKKERRSSECAVNCSKPINFTKLEPKRVWNDKWRDAFMFYIPLIGFGIGQLSWCALVTQYTHCTHRQRQTKNQHDKYSVKWEKHIHIYAHSHTNHTYCVPFGDNLYKYKYKFNYADVKLIEWNFGYHLRAVCLRIIC